jgi:hypothetical protein
VSDLLLVPGLCDIEVTITTPILFDVRGSIHARANDVFVFFVVSAGEPARTAHVTITVLIDQEGFKKFVYPLVVLVEVVTFRFLNISQHSV